MTYRERCMECGHRESKKEAKKREKRLKKLRKNAVQAPFADSMTLAILDEVGPSQILRPLIRSHDGPTTFRWEKES